MDKKYFILADSQQQAIDYWNNSQYDLTDLVLALTDNGIVEGGMLYEVFKEENFLKLMNIFKFNFALAKSEIGVNGEYVQRNENVYDVNYNPKRNASVLTLSKEEMQSKAKEVYAEIEEQLKKVIKSLSKQIK